LKKSILYIQHAGALGGSCMSLLYTIQGLDASRFEPVVALIRPCRELIDFYEKAGFKVVPAPGIYTLEHTSLSWARMSSPLACLSMVRGLFHWRQSMRLTLNLVAKVKPDLVHLNSVVLVPSAMALAKTNIPFVWHVREAPVKGYLGVRTSFVASMLKRLGKEVIFISKSDRKNWVANQRGRVIYNFVDLRIFHPRVPADELKRNLQISEGNKVVLYMGGIAKVKGIYIFLEAIRIVRQSISNLVCLMPGCNFSSSGGLISLILRKVLPLIGSGVLAQKVRKRVQELNLESCLRILPFQEDIAPFIAASDLVVFPSLMPHFARPIVEAAAMGKPSVGSDLGGVNELIEHGRTGLLVEPGSPTALAEAIEELLTNQKKLKTLGENALAKARREFDAKQQIAKITQIYDSLLE